MGSNSKLLRADALVLVAASSVAFLLDALGAPIVGVGFVDAHELALIAGLLLWCPAPRRCWHLSAVAVHLLFAAATLAHWQTLAPGRMLAAAIVTTAMHLAFAGLQAFAARETGSARQLAAAA